MFDEFRGEPLLQPEIQSHILYAFTELLFSPDTEIIADICSAIAYLCEIRPRENSQICFEQGIPSRLVDLCQSTLGIAIRPLCVIIAMSPVDLHRKVLMSSLFPNVLKLMVKEYANILTPWKVSHNLPATRSGPIVGTTGSHIGLLESNSNTKLLDDSAVDICRAMLVLFQTDNLYLSLAAQLDFTKYLCQCLTAGHGSYEVKRCSAYCLCYIILKEPSSEPHLLQEQLSALRECFTSTDNNLLLQVLQSVLQLFMIYRRRRVETDTGLANDSTLIWLCNHPVASIAGYAVKIVDLFHSADDSDDLL